MNELIKNEAEKHYKDQGYVLNEDDTEWIINTFTAGFNRCIELKINELEERLKIAAEALEYYGSPHSWDHKGCHGGDQGHRFRINVLDRNEINPEWKGILVGGKRAREALEKIK